jgi:hypothetical protein
MFQASIHHFSQVLIIDLNNVDTAKIPKEKIKIAI